MTDTTAISAPQGIIPPQDDLVPMVGVRTSEADLVPIPSHVPPTAISGKERTLYGQQLRAGAINSIQIANRIDPEHANLIILEESQMAVINERWKQVQTLLSQQAAKITDMEKINENAQVELASAKQSLIELQGVQAEKDTEIASLTAANAVMNEAITKVKEVLGSMPDEEDAAALKEMADTVEAASKAAIEDDNSMNKSLTAAQKKRKDDGQGVLLG